MAHISAKKKKKNIIVKLAPGRQALTLPAGHVSRDGAPGVAPGVVAPGVGTLLGPNPAAKTSPHRRRSLGAYLTLYRRGPLFQIPSPPLLYQRGNLLRKVAHPFFGRGPSGAELGAKRSLAGLIGPDSCFLETVAQGRQGRALTGGSPGKGSLS